MSSPLDAASATDGDDFLTEEPEVSDSEDGEAEEGTSTFEDDEESNAADLSNDEDIFADSDVESPARMPRATYSRLRRAFKHEIRLIETMEERAAQDLAYNLYGIWLEKRSSYAKNARSLAHPWNSKFRYFQRRQNATAMLKDLWTAWPLPASRVPSTEDWKSTVRDERCAKHREGEPEVSVTSTFGAEDGRDLQIAQAQLEDALSAPALQQARLRFDRLRQADLRQAESLQAKLPPAESLQEEPDHADSRTEGSLSVGALPVSVLGCSHCLKTKQDCISQPGRPCSVCLYAGRECSRLRPPSYPVAVNKTTCPLQSNLQSMYPRLDEDMSIRIIQPSLASIISRKLDPLLRSMKRSRIGQLVPYYAGPEDEVVSRKRRRQAFHPRSGEKKEYTSAEAFDKIIPGQQTGLRDWSDVLSIAASVGWDAHVLQRATKRCSRLFSEEMSMITLGTSEEIRVKSRLRKAGAPSLLGWSLESLCCPHRDCGHNSRPFSHSKGISDHIREKHKWDPVMDVAQLGRLEGGVHVDGFLQLVHPERRSPWGTTRGHYEQGKQRVTSK